MSIPYDLMEVIKLIGGTLKPNLKKILCVISSVLLSFLPDLCHSFRLLWIKVGVPEVKPGALRMEAGVPEAEARALSLEAGVQEVKPGAPRLKAGVFS